MILQKFFFKLEDHVYGPTFHVLVILLCLVGGLVGVFWWIHSPLVGLTLHTLYIFIYKRYKRRWNERENIIKELMVGVDIDTTLYGDTPP